MCVCVKTQKSNLNVLQNTDCVTPSNQPPSPDCKGKDKDTHTLKHGHTFPPPPSSFPIERDRGSLDVYPLVLASYPHIYTQTHTHILVPCAPTHHPHAHTSLLSAAYDDTKGNNPHQQATQPNLTTNIPPSFFLLSLLRFRSAISPIHTHTHTHIILPLLVYIHNHIPPLAHSHIHVLTLTPTHTHTHIHTHTQAHNHFFVRRRCLVWSSSLPFKQDPFVLLSLTQTEAPRSHTQSGAKPLAGGDTHTHINTHTHTHTHTHKSMARPMQRRPTLPLARRVHFLPLVVLALALASSLLVSTTAHQEAAHVDATGGMRYVCVCVCVCLHR
jgi:hypothetical protein